MKKIYSLLALFLLLMGTATSAVAQQALTTGYYRIKNAKTPLFGLENPSLVVNGSALGLKAGASLTGTEDVWYVEDMGVGTDGKTKYYIKHMDTGQYIVAGPSVPVATSGACFYAINYDATL